MNNLKSKIHNLLIKSFIYLIPLGVLVLILSHFEAFGTIGNNLLGKSLGIIFIYWFLCSLYILFAIMFSTEFRESAFVRLGGIKERDEREELIVASAMKSSFLFTLGILIILLAFSTTRTTKSLDNISSKNSFTIGHFDFKAGPIDRPQEVAPTEAREYKTYDIPLSKTSLILLIIFVQIFSYHTFARKLSKE